MRLTIPHWFDFGEDRVHVGDDLVRAEAWDALRINTDGPFSVATTRAAFEDAANGRPEIRARAERVVSLSRARGVRRLASYGVGAALLELWMKRLAPDLELTVTDYAERTVERVATIFPEAAVVRHDLMGDPPLDADLHVFHRIDTELTNRQWRAVLRRFASVPVLVVATEVIDLDRALDELLGRLRRRNATRAGWLRTRASFEAIYGSQHRIEPLEVADLHGWLLEPAASVAPRHRES